MLRQLEIHSVRQHVSESLGLPLPPSIAIELDVVWFSTLELSFATWFQPSDVVSLILGVKLFQHCLIHSCLCGRHPHDVLVGRNLRIRVVLSSAR